MGEGAVHPVGGDEEKTRAFRGFHADMDLDEVRRMNEADKTAVLDYLYDDQPAREMPYQAPVADSSSETVAFSPYRGSRSTADASDARDPWDTGPPMAMPSIRAIPMRARRRFSHLLPETRPKAASGKAGGADMVPTVILKSRCIRVPAM